MTEKRKNSISGGIALVTFGVIFLLVTMKLASWSNLLEIFLTYWPVLIILAGVKLVFSSFKLGYILEILIDLIINALIIVLLLFPKNIIVDRGMEQENSPAEEKVVNNVNATKVEYHLNMGAASYKVSDNNSENTFFASSDGGLVNVRNYFDESSKTYSVYFDNDMPGIRNSFRTSKRNYLVQTSASLPADYYVKVGATSGEFRLENAAINKFSADIGASSVILEFTEKTLPSTIDLKVGAGSAEIMLPKGVTVVTKYSIGMGSLNAVDKEIAVLGANGEYTYNQESLKKVTIDLNIGAGSVDIKVQD